MFKFKSYNMKKAEEKNDKEESKTSSSTGTLKKTTSSSYVSSTGTLKKPTSSSYVSPKKKTMPSAKEIKAISNKQSPEYSRKIYPKKTVTEWHENKTYSTKNKNKNKKVVIPTPHKKLERK